MRRGGLFVFGGLLALGLVILLVTGLTKRDALAFTLGVTSGGPAAELDARESVCQQPVRVPDGAAAFDDVVVALGTYERPGPPVDLTLVAVRSGRLLASGRLAGGYADITRAPEQRIRVGRVTTREPFRVCLRNLGPNRVAVYGNGDVAARISQAVIDGVPTGTDLNLRFERASERSLLSRTFAMLHRASLFDASWFGTWTLVLVALAVLACVPFLLVRALRAAE
jgi:hypothetical protein